MKPKAVEKISTFDGTVIKLYYSITAAAVDNQVSYNKMLSLLNTGEVYKRNRFKIYGEALRRIEVWLPIKQMNGEEIVAEFKNILEASKELGYNRNYISNHIKYGTADKWGCTWVKLEKPN